MQGHTPHVLASPARLGVPSAHSPSLPPNTNPLPNPNPNPNPNPRAPLSSTTGVAAAAAAAAISPSLLPLLPPLPRAQSLLLQMSSLASKLFDLSQNRAFWLTSYRGSFPAFLPASAPSSSFPAPSSAKDLLALFTTLQTQLFGAVAELQEILDLQDSKAKISREVRAKDATLLAFTKKIREAHQVLDHLVDDYSDYRCDPKRSKSSSNGHEDAETEGDHHFSLRSSLDLQDILSYAHRISYTTFAPPEHGAGLPLRGALPPAPQDNEMRASQLYHFADLDVGVPKKPSEAKEQISDKLTEPLMEPTLPREEPAASVPVPRLPITVPPGWRKGMPVELPSELPPVPPGWKPGDPITLPLEGVVAGNKAEEQRIGGVAGVHAGPAMAPEPIQVKYVQLDINPGDQDDYSSEYSSEVGSSEEDED